MASVALRWSERARRSIVARRIRDQVTKREAPPLGSPLSAHERAEIAAQVEAALVAEIAAAQAEADRLVTTA